MKNPHKLAILPAFKKVVESVHRLDERGLLYEINYDANYYTLSDMLEMFVSAGCSTFTAKTVEGDPIMARNYDFRHFRNGQETEDKDITGLAVIVHGNNPKAKYKSIGVADGYWMDFKNGSMFEGCLDDGKTDTSALMLIPFLCMDGANEAGLAVSIMWLPTKNEWTEIDYIAPEDLDPLVLKKSKKFIYDEPGKVPQELDALAGSKTICINTADKKAWKNYKNFAVWQKEKGKKTTYHPILMRMMLDNCASVEEAVELAKSMNVRSAMPDSDYHIMITDANGKTVVLEWQDNKLVVNDIDHATNFYICRDDKYGAGYERDEIIRAAQHKYKEKGMPENVAKYALALASQNAIDGSDGGFTQWSSIYNLAKHTLKLWLFMDYDKQYNFTI